MKYIVLFCCFFYCFSPLMAQNEPPVVEDVPVAVDDIDDASMEYEPETASDQGQKEIFGLHKERVVRRKISSDQWQRAADQLDYSNDVPEAVKKPVADPVKPNQTPAPRFEWNWAFWKGFSKVLSVIVLLSLGGWLIYNLVQSPSNNIIRAEDGTEITLANLDEYIQETDLQRFLREAVEKGNYSQAVRIYYLQIIKDLSKKEAILWRKEKTNRDYMREMRNHPLSTDFRTATRTYEAVWYGNGELDKAIFGRIEGQMNNFLAKIA